MHGFLCLTFYHSFLWIVYEYLLNVVPDSETDLFWC